MILLKNWAREFLAVVMRVLGVVTLIRHFISTQKVTIIVYHDPSPEVFVKHLKFLAKRYNFISFKNLINAIKKCDISMIPQNSLVLTMDDGHKGNIKLLDTFRAYGIEPMIYLCSQVVNTNRKFWWQVEGADGRALKKLPHNKLLSFLESKADYKPEKDYYCKQALGLAELVKLSAQVEFGSHSRHHSTLVNCSGKRCLEEVILSKKELEHLLSQHVDHFAYPNGDYSTREINNVKDAKYLSARTLDVGWNTIKTDPYRLKAMVVEDDASINVLSCQVSGIFGYLHYLIKGSFNGKRPHCIS